MEDVGLRDEGDDGCLGVEQGAHLRVVLDLDSGLARGAEGDELRGLQVELLAGTGEELGVLRHGPGPAALDEAHAVAIEETGDGELVVDAVGDALALGAVAQGRVIDMEGIPQGQGRHVVLLKQKAPRGCEGLRIDAAGRRRCAR